MKPLPKFKGHSLVFTQPHISYQNGLLTIHVIKGDYWVEVERNKITMFQFIEKQAKGQMMLLDNRLLRKVRKIWRRRSNVTGGMANLSKAEYFFADDKQRVPPAHHVTIIKDYEP